MIKESRMTDEKWVSVQKAEDVCELANLMIYKRWIKLNFVFKCPCVNWKLGQQKKSSEWETNPTRGI